VLARFLDVGFRKDGAAPYDRQAFWNSLYRIPRDANPFGYLNLLGTPRDEDSEMYADREDRLRVFAGKWQALIAKGTEDAKKEGGAVGRAASTLGQVLSQATQDYSETGLKTG